MRDKGKMGVEYFTPVPHHLDNNLEQKLLSLTKENKVFIKFSIVFEFEMFVHLDP